MNIRWRFDEKWVGNWKFFSESLNEFTVDENFVLSSVSKRFLPWIIHSTFNSTFVAVSQLLLIIGSRALYERTSVINDHQWCKVSYLFFDRDRLATLIVRQIHILRLHVSHYRWYFHLMTLWVIDRYSIVGAGIRTLGFSISNHLVASCGSWTEATESL